MQVYGRAGGEGFRENATHRTGHSRLSAVAMASAIASLALLPSCSCAQVNVTTYHNDIGRTGQNLNETILTPSNVNATQFGKLFSQPVDGQIYAQPLYLHGVKINGVAHNVVYVATEGDSVYAFDADTNGGTNSSPLWHASMLTAAHGAAANATTVPSTVVGYDLQPQIGITGTPVIDPVSGTLYVVSAAIEKGDPIQRLHALDVTTGLEKFGGPVVITATVSGTGNGSVNGKLTFDSLWEHNRPGLLLLNGIVWIGFGSHEDNGPWHGWVLGYSASTLKQTGVLCLSPNGEGAGIWMAGDALAADLLDPVNHPYGRMFFATGNGDFTATAPPYKNTMSYGDSHVAVDLTNGVPTVTDDFTTNQQAALDAEDEDVGSGGVMLLPTQTAGKYPHLLVQAGKAGTLFLLNRDNLGGYNTSADQALQAEANAVGGPGAWSTPAYWNGNVYYWGRYAKLQAFTLANGQLVASPTQGSEEYLYPGATPSISANGNAQGIVWSINPGSFASGGPAILDAFNASNIAEKLYSSGTNPARDAAGPANKFTPPTVVNGKVYVGTGSEIDIYGLLAATPVTSTPVIAPGSKSFTGSVSVTISDATKGATVYYTTDGSTPTTASAKYSGPISVTLSETVRAIASITGQLTSAAASATYTNTAQTDAVVFSVPAGTYAATQSLVLTDASPKAAIYYTTDGSTPTTSSRKYTAAISVSSSETVTAVGVAPGFSAGPIVAQSYTIVNPNAGFSFNDGFAESTSVMVLNGSTDLNDTRLQLTDGLANEAGSAWYSNPVSVRAFTTDFTFELSNPEADGITFAIQNSPKLLSALGGIGNQLGYGGIAKSVAVKFDLHNSQTGAKDNATGLFLNGASPVSPEIVIPTAKVDLHSGDTMEVQIVYDGTTLTMTITDMVTSGSWSTSWAVNIPGTVGATVAYVGFTGSTGGETASQKILTWSYTVNPVLTAKPTCSSAGGTYNQAQTVTLTDATSGAVIYYTLNGTTPTASSTKYTTPVKIAQSETLQAVALAPTDALSGVSSATFKLVAATPVLSLPAGSYTGTQTVTVTSATPTAKIFYTLNGTTPGASSTVYTGPIKISASATLKVIAAETGFTSSAVVSAVYKITQ